MKLTHDQARAIGLLAREGGSGIVANCRTSLYDVPFIHWRTVDALVAKGLLTKPERDSAGELWVRLTRGGL